MKRRRFGLPRGYGRDPFRKGLKSTAPHSKDPKQLSLDLTAQPRPSPWPEHQVDLEEYIASLGEKRT